MSSDKSVTQVPGCTTDPHSQLAQATVAREVVGDDSAGLAISDPYLGYLFTDLDQRQSCFAQLIHDFRRMAERKKDLR